MKILKPTLLAFILLLTGCSKDNNLENDQLEQTNKIEPQFGFSSVDAPKSLKNSLETPFKSEKLNSFLNGIDVSLESFDFENAKIVKTDLSKASAFVARAKNYNKENKTNFALSYVVESSGELIKPMITKITVSNSSEKTVEYLNLESGMISKISFLDGKVINTQTISLYPSFIQTKCGRATADCITGAYADEGWASVALWVASAIQPEIMVGAAVYCAYTECR